MAKTVYFNVRELPVGASISRQIVGIDSPERVLQPLQFEGEVASEITDLGRLYKDLHKGSITSGDELALWNLYLLSELGKAKPTEEQRKVLDYLFNEIGLGNICDNAVNYDKGDKRAKKPNDSYRSVLWIVEPDGFEKVNDVWRAKGGDAHPAVIPERGYVRLTNDGQYHPLGYPFETTKTRKEAEKSWTDAGFSQEFAILAVSYFWSRNEDRGTAAVDRWCWDDDDGRFSLGADRDPDAGGGLVGRLSVGRSASGARHGSGYI